MRSRRRDERDYLAQFGWTEDDTSATAKQWRDHQIRKGRRGPDDGSRQMMEVYDTPD